jgi:hypothetical protein
VLGVGSGLQDDPGGSPGCLEEIARRGQGAAAHPEDRPWFFSGADPDGLESALQRLFGGTMRPSCTMTLERLPPDPDQVAVYADGHPVPRNRNDGWDYGSSDDLQRLQFFGEYCRRLSRFQIEGIEVRYACPPCAGEGLRCD